MNRLIFITMILVIALVAGCSKEDQLLFSDIARVQINDTSTISSTFIYEPSGKIRDTVYIKVITIGKTASYDRPVKLVQVAEKNEPNPAVAGVQYLSLDDASVKPLMVVKADSVQSLIPVILLRDTSLKTNTYSLRIELVGNTEFGLGEVQRRSVAIRFSDRLERFYSWRVDGTQASAYNSFGKYSTRKHQFMVDVLHEQIDEVWYQAALSIGAATHYKNLLKEALAKYNSDPANTASGKAPMKETDIAGSPLITFP